MDELCIFSPQLEQYLKELVDEEEKKEADAEVEVPPAMACSAKAKARSSSLDCSTNPHI